MTETHNVLHVETGLGEHLEVLADEVVVRGAAASSHSESEIRVNVTKAIFVLLGGA